MKVTRSSRRFQFAVTAAQRTVSIVAISLGEIAQAQQPAFLENGLAAYYPFNGNSKDASGNSNDGVEYRVSYTTDRFGKTESAVRFAESGLPNSISISQPIFRTGQVDFATFAWVSLPDIAEAGSIGTLFNTRPHTGFSMLFGTPGHPGEMRFALGNGISWKSVEEYDGIAGWRQGEWKQVGFVKAGDTFTVFADGQPIRRGSIASSFSVDSGLLIGSANPLNEVEGYAPYNLNAVVDDVRIYNRALSDSEVKGLYDYENAVSKVPESSEYTAAFGLGLVFAAAFAQRGKL